MNFKQKILSKLVTTSLARSFIREFGNHDVIDLLDSTVAFVRKFSGAERAASIEKVLIEGSVLSYVSISNKYFTKDDLWLVRDPLIILWSNFVDMVEIRFLFDVELIQENFQKLKDVTADVIFPFLTELDIRKVHEIAEAFDYFSQDTFLRAFFEDPQYLADRKHICAVLRKLWFE